MACYLRVYGEKFDVDAFQAEHDVEFSTVHRRGEPEYPKTKPDGPKKTTSGFNVMVSDAEQDNIDRQIDDAIAFLKNKHNIGLVNKLVACEGVEWAGLDFGLVLKDPKKFPVQFYNFPAELTKQAGKLNLCLEMSIYLF